MSQLWSLLPLLFFFAAGVLLWMGSAWFGIWLRRRVGFWLAAILCSLPLPLLVFGAGWLMLATIQGMDDVSALFGFLLMVGGAALLPISLVVNAATIHFVGLRARPAAAEVSHVFD